MSGVVGGEGRAAALAQCAQTQRAAPVELAAPASRSAPNSALTHQHSVRLPAAIAQRFA